MDSLAEMDAAAAGTPPLDTLLAQYSAGVIDRRALEQASGLWFGDILTALAERGLRLPRVDSGIHYTPAQQRLFDQVFG
ncbi:MAG: hypothetical protein ACEQSK_09375 [Sphingomonadaceae bacterium]